MTQAKNSRVFQEKSVKDVITEVLKDYKIEPDWKLEDASVYPKLDYCVQYNETDFDFMHRLLEEVGIYYFFEHEEKSHKIVFIDSMTQHEPHPANATLKWGRAMTSEPTIMNWHVQKEVRTAKTMLTDYDFLAPETEIEGTKDAKKPPKMLGKMEWFEHPARVVQNGVKPEQTEGRHRGHAARHGAPGRAAQRVCIGDRDDQHARPRHRHDVRRRSRTVQGRQGHVPDGERRLPDGFRGL